MKKLLLLSAVALASLTASAQTVSLTVLDEPVENGATVNSYCFNKIEMPYEDEFITMYEMNPEIFATSTTTGTYNITVTNKTTDAVPSGPVFCWPDACDPVSTSKTNTGTLTANEPTDLGIHTGQWYDFQWEDPETPFTVCVEIKIENPLNSSDTFTATVNMIYDPAADAAVDGFEIDNDAPKAYFDLTGRQVLNPAKGQIVIERQGNKVRKVVK